MADEPEGDDVKAISTLLSVLKPLNPDTRVLVLEFVLKRLGISLTSSGAEPPPPKFTATEFNPTSAQRPPAQGHSGVIDIRSFAAEKNPNTVNEKVALIAYYLAHLAPPSERRDYLTAEDIEPYFIQAGFHLPTSPARITLSNAKNAGYLNASERGQYTLNSVGYNLVAHKLSGEETGERKRKTAKKATKKRKRSKANK